MFYILIVLYKKSLGESQTLQGIIDAAAIINATNSVVHIWDNSPSASLTEEDKSELNKKILVRYTSCTENKPLSFVYNTAIRFLQTQEKLNYLVLLDHDSGISPAYFKELQAIISTGSPDIILPQAIFGDKIISPARLFLVKGKYFKNILPGIYSKKLLAVNSGMVISKNFLSKTEFMYDEQLLNYGTDNYFMNFSNKHGAVFYIMNFRFDHGYSFYELTDNIKRAEIFWQIKRANKLAFSSNILEFVCIHIYNFMASIKNAFKYRSFRFIIVPKKLKSIK